MRVRTFDCLATKRAGSSGMLVAVLFCCWMSAVGTPEKIEIDGLVARALYFVHSVAFFFFLTGAFSFFFGLGYLLTVI